MAGRAAASINRESFLEDRVGRTFVDVVNDPKQPFDAVLEFFNDPDRQRRMEESELHHNRPPLAGVVRELESLPAVDRFLAAQHPRDAKRLRQAVGVIVRIIMERRGWKTTGKKGSLGVRAARARRSPTPGSCHNTGGLAFWFLRAERYQRPDGMPYRSVRARSKDLDTAPAARSTRNSLPPSNGANGRTPRQARPKR